MSMTGQVTYRANELLDSAISADAPIRMRGGCYRTGRGWITCNIAGATLTVEDDRRDYGEERFITIGFLDETMVVLVWTPRDGTRRIISMRKANERERTLYGPRL